MSMDAAIHAALYGPEKKKLKVYDHEFNVKPIERSRRGSGMTIMGHISHHLRFRPDDQVYYTVILEKGVIQDIKTAINRGGLTPIAAPIISALAEYFGGVAVPPDKVASVGRTLGRLYDGGWESAVSIMITNITLAVGAEEFGKEATSPKTVNLYDLAPQARWVSGLLLDDGHSTTNDTPLPWNGPDGDSQGLVRLEVMPLENGASGAALMTHPPWVGSGTIKGFFPGVRLTGSPVFEAEVGYRQGAVYTDGVTFMVWEHHMENWGEVWNLIAQTQKGYTGRLEPIRVNLNHLAGKEVGLELRVDAGHSSGQDWAVWVRPRMVM
jgi:hypothetical protein